MPPWAWLYVAFVVGLYSIIGTLRYQAWKREVARDKRRAEMWQRLKAIGYPQPPKPRLPSPPRRRWFDADGVEILED